MTTRTAIVDAALDYGERGMPIFPCWWIQAGQRCACGHPGCKNPGKHPIGDVVPNGLKNATTDAALLTTWWRRYPLAHIATPTNWCAVLDVDPRHGGDVALEALERQHGPLPETAEVLTGGGGRHLYFQPVDGLRCSSGNVGAGLDIRADGGYVLLPPSGHVSGGIYLDELLHPLFDTPLAPLPAWVLSRARAKASQNGDGSPEPPEWAALLAGAPAGARHSIACQIAGHYLRALGADAAGEVEQILIGFCVRCAPPFPEVEARGIVRDLAVKERQAGVAKVAPSDIWASAIPAPAFLTESEAAVVFLEPQLLVRGAITEMFAPRGLGKTQVAYAIGLRLARAGLRVLLVDRDNPRHEVRRRLRAWGAATAPTFKVIGRDKAPALTDAAAWQAFPLATYDVVIIDSIDAATEGVGEGDSAKPAKALAPILDLARRDDGPAILVLGNVIKSGAHSRGCGIIEDRADIVYEVRDATDLRPSGTKDWWYELPAADVAAWAQRASRRKRRDVYRLAFVPSKFRLGEEPEPFIFEIDHRPTPWALRDVTGEVVATGEAAREQAEAERVATAERAIGRWGSRCSDERKPARSRSRRATPKRSSKRKA